jgi:hypothetical protein
LGRRYSACLAQQQKEAARRLFEPVAKQAARDEARGNPPRTPFASCSPYCAASSHACGCSILNPSAKGLAAIATPREARAVYSGRAEWPGAKTTAEPRTASPSAGGFGFGCRFG